MIDEWNRKVHEKQINEDGDCSEYVPDSEKKWFLENAPPQIPGNLITIPMQHLHACFIDVKYDRSSPPFELEAESNISYSFGLNEMLELTFDGTFVVRASFYFRWVDYRLWYNEEVNFNVSDARGRSLAGSNGWRFPDHAELPANEIWVPSFYLENCVAADCAVRPSNETLAYVHSNGTVELHLEARLEASCELNMRLFPFDDQNCRLLFVFQKMHRGRHVRLLPLNELYMPYMHDHDEWRVTRLNHNAERLWGYKLVQNSTGLWRRTRALLPLQRYYLTSCSYVMSKIHEFSIITCHYSTTEF